MRQAIHKDIKDEWAIVFRTSSEESAPQWPRNCSAAAPRGGAVVVEEEWARKKGCRDPAAPPFGKPGSIFAVRARDRATFWTESVNGAQQTPDACNNCRPPRRACAWEAADWHLNGQSREKGVDVRKYTEQGRLCCLSKPWPSKVSGKQASRLLPPDAHPLRAPLPVFPTHPWLRSAALSAPDRIFRSPGASVRAPTPTAGEPHSPCLAWGGEAWFPASPGRYWNGWVVGSQRLGRAKRRMTGREGNCSYCCCYCRLRHQRCSPRRGLCPFPGTPAPPHGASALGSRALCALASARCLGGRAAGRRPWLLKNDENGYKTLRMRGSRGLHVCLKISTPLPSPGLYPRRIKRSVP